MHQSHGTLLKHLAVVLVIKLLLLAALWYAFIAPQRKQVDSATAAQHLLSTNGNAPSPQEARSDLGTTR